MVTPSEQISERYCLNLSKFWCDWFDGAATAFKLPGMMRQPLLAGDLCREAPEQIWPGFMLPDALPIIGNRYGDWICARVTENDELGELIYWYHGGGDWIPVGSSLSAVLVHDVVDQFRSVRKQMLRGASESRADSQAGVLLRLADDNFSAWLSMHLSEDARSSELDIDVRSSLDRLITRLSEADYEAALKLLYQNRWVEDAVTCDLIDLALQGPLESISSQHIAKAANLPWFPEYVRLLFDPSQASQETRQRILELDSLEHRDWPCQDWQLAAELAGKVALRRSDLGWTATVLGWFHEKNGDLARAIVAYQNGMHASAFADQSVRLNSHAEVDEYGKFSTARLVALREHWTGELLSDSYLQIFRNPRKRSLLVDVCEYWKTLGYERETEGDFTTAYQHYYAAGWDMGVSRLSDYAEILSSLHRSTLGAGWMARTKLIETHLRCLSSRVKR